MPTRQRRRQTFQALKGKTKNILHNDDYSRKQKKQARAELQKARTTFNKRVRNSPVKGKLGRPKKKTTKRTTS